MTYRMIQVGLGDFGQRWSRVVVRHPQWEYAAIATRDSDIRRRIGENCDVPAGSRFETLDLALRSGVLADAVLVTTPHFRHLDEIRMGVAAGMHVLVEKPLAGTWNDCVQIRKLAEESNRVLMVAENYRFGHGARKAREVVASGEIGRPEFLSLNYFVGHVFPKGDWRNDYEFPLLVENTTHQFDLVRYITGTNALRVFCSSHASKRTTHWKYPTSTAVFQMTGDFQFTFSGSWAYPEFRTPWEGEWRLCGTEGSLIWRSDRILVERKGDIREIPVPSEDSDATLTATFQEFHDSLTKNRPPTTSVEDNIQTVAMVFAAIESSKCNSEVDVQALLNGKAMK